MYNFKSLTVATIIIFECKVRVFTEERFIPTNKNKENFGSCGLQPSPNPGRMLIIKANRSHIVLYVYYRTCRYFTSHFDLFNVNVRYIVSQENMYGVWSSI